MTAADEDLTAARVRRAAGDRRRNNRRTNPEASPPYFETFDRIAAALEGIRDALASQPGAAPARRPDAPDLRDHGAG